MSPGRSVSLSSPCGANGELGASAGRGAENMTAVLTNDAGLGVGEDRGDVEAMFAFDIQEVRVGALYESLKFVHTLLSLRVGVQKVHFHCAKSVFRAKIYI